MFDSKNPSLITAAAVSSQDDSMANNIAGLFLFIKFVFACQKVLTALWLNS
jgi:hypothetical protein